MKTLLFMGLTGSAAAVVLFALRPIIERRVSKTLLYYLWVPVLLRLILPVGVPVALPEPTGETESAAEYSRTEFVSEAEPTIYEAEMTARTGPRLTELIPAVWAAGAAGVLLWQLAAYFSFRARLSRTLREPSEEARRLLASLPHSHGAALYVSSMDGTPFMAGLVRPVIVLPEAELTESELRYVLAHELTHKRRGDIFYKLLTMTACAVHWYNPIVWLMSRDTGILCELSCDEEVIKGLDEESRLCYGAAILRCAAREKRLSPLTTGFSGGKRALRKRIISIRDYKSVGAVSAVLGIMLAVLMTACSAVMVTDAKPVDTDVQDPVFPETAAVSTTAPEKETEPGEEKMEITYNGVPLRTLDPVEGFKEFTITPEEYQIKLGVTKGYVPVAWISGDKNVVTVSGGVVTYVGKGVTTITAIAEGGEQASCIVRTEGTGDKEKAEYLEQRTLVISELEAQIDSIENKLDDYERELFILKGEEEKSENSEQRMIKIRELEAKTDLIEKNLVECRQVILILKS